MATKKFKGTSNSSKPPLKDCKPVESKSQKQKKRKEAREEARKEAKARAAAKALQKPAGPGEKHGEAVRDAKDDQACSNMGSHVSTSGGEPMAVDIKTKESHMKAAEHSQIELTSTATGGAGSSIKTRDDPEKKIEILKHGDNLQANSTSNATDIASRLTSGSSHDKENVKAAAKPELKTPVTNCLAATLADNFQAGIEGQREEIDRCNASNANMKSAQELKRENEKLQGTIRDLESKVSHHINEIKNLSKENNKLKKDKDRAYGKAAKNHKDFEAMLGEEVLRLTEERNKAVLDYQDLLLRQQEESFNHLEPAEWAPEADADIITRLRVLHDRMGRVRSFAVSNFKEVQFGEGSEDKKEELQYLVSSVLHKGNLGAMPVGMSAGKQAGEVLVALLAHAVYTRVMRDPFLFDRDFERDLSELGTMYEALLAVNEQDAHAWRTQTLRHLLPRSVQETRAAAELIEKTTLRITQAAEAVADDFLTSPAAHLFKEATIETASAEIRSIFEAAAQEAYILWTRKTSLKVSTLADLEANPMYDPNDKRMLTHKLIFSDEGPQQHKGRPVKMICHPLLEVCGTDDGDDFKTRRVWMPAEVWFPWAEEDPGEKKSESMKPDEKKTLDKENVGAKNKKHNGNKNKKKQGTKKR